MATYRSDIDGLRAVAVGAVVLFHAFPRWIHGGFVGVDVFFVISGFLISGIILDELSAQRFSFYDFYARRIRRIFPALGLVLAACLAFGWLSNLPVEFEQLGKHVLGGSAFVANLVLLSEVSYFDPGAATKPLLHLWSLGIEEQYYLIWPLALFFLRASSRMTLACIVLIGAASFAANVALVGRYPDEAFYLPITRFWELMIGSLLAYIARLPNAGSNGIRSWVFPEGQAAATRATMQAWLGLALIIVSVLLFRESDAFPGWRAALPTIGTAAIIAAGPTAWLNRAVLSTRPMVYVGLISYPLYLWHWPVLVYLKQCLAAPSVGARVAAIAFAAALAIATYHWVERPLRHQSVRGKGRRLVAGLTVAMVGIAGVGVLAWQRGLTPIAAKSPELVSISNAIVDVAEPGGIQVLQGNTAGPRTLFFGDSYMKHYLPRVRAYLAQSTTATVTAEFRTRGGCNVIPALDRVSRGRCAPFIQSAYDRALHADVGVVVIAASWRQLLLHGDYYFTDEPGREPARLYPERRDEVLRRFTEAVRKLSQAGKTVVVLTSPPYGSEFDPQRMMDRRNVVPIPRIVPSVPRREALRETLQLDKDIETAAVSGGAVVMHPADWLCSDAACSTVDPSGHPISPDGAHLRPSFVAKNLHQLDALVTVQSLAQLKN